MSKFTATCQTMGFYGKNFEILSHEKEKCGSRLVGLLLLRISVTDG